MAYIHILCHGRDFAIYTRHTYMAYIHTGIPMPYTRHTYMAYIYIYGSGQPYNLYPAQGLAKGATEGTFATNRSLNHKDRWKMEELLGLAYWVGVHTKCQAGRHSLCTAMHAVCV